MSISPKEEDEKIAKLMKMDEYIVLNNGNYFIRKSKMWQLDDYTIIIVPTPVTIAIDSGIFAIEGLTTVAKAPPVALISDE